MLRLITLYGAKCWPDKNSYLQKMKIAEIRMLRRMSKHTRKDKIRYRDIRDKVGVASIEENMQEMRLRWFVHVQRI